MPRIVDAPNTYNPALIVLAGKGYEMGLYPSDDEDSLGDWWARKGEWEFVASDPLRLLGLASIWESRGDNWKGESDADLHEKLIDEVYGES